MAEEFIKNEEETAQELETARSPALLAQEQQRAEEEEQKKEQEANKMGWGIFIIASILSIIADTIEILTLGTIGWFVGLFIDFILFILLGSTQAGRKQWKKLISALVVETIPGLDVLPIRTIMVLWSFVASRPKLVSKIQKGLKVASVIPSPVSAQLKVASRAVGAVAQATASQEQE